jgi:hypothetical protein
MTADFDAAAHATFATFLREMDDRLQQLELLADEDGLYLDYNEVSLADFETLLGWLLDEARTSGGDATSIIVTGARYLGEVMRRVHGGQWHLSLDDPKSVHYNTPVIVGHNASGTEFAPIFLCRAFAKRRQLGLFARAIRSQIAPESLDLGSLLAQEQNSR